MKHLLITLLLASFVTVQVHAGYTKIKDSKKMASSYSLEDSGLENSGYTSEIEEDSLATYYCQGQTHAVKACDQKLKRRHTKTKGSFKTQPNPESNKAEIHATCAILTKTAQQINQDRRKKRTAATMIVIKTN
jgi:hypothetical protein